MINFAPNVTELIDIVNDWTDLPLILQNAAKAEAEILFPSLISDEIEALVNAFIQGQATADELESFLIAVVSGTTANILTVGNILALASTTGSATTISSINTSINNVYGTVVLDQIANEAQILLNSALLTYQTKFLSIGSAIGVNPAQQILDDILAAKSKLNTLIVLL